MRDAFQIWVDAVCEQVRFQPDRKGIARELRVHYEDHVRDLLRLGRDPALAEDFLRMGLDSLSVAPSAVLPLREHIRSLDLSRDAKPASQ